MTQDLKTKIAEAIAVKEITFTGPSSVQAKKLIQRDGGPSPRQRRQAQAVLQAIHDAGKEIIDREELAKLRDDLFDAQTSAECVGWVRAASEEITGGNCAFVDDDLAVLSHLAKRAADAGLVDRLSPQIAAKATAAAQARAMIQASQPKTEEG